MQDKYFGRTSIETVFKTGKDFLSLLPLSKWSMQTVLSSSFPTGFKDVMEITTLKAKKYRGEKWTQ